MISAWWLLAAVPVASLPAFGFLAETAPTLDYMDDSNEVQR